MIKLKTGMTISFINYEVEVEISGEEPKLSES